MHLIHHRFRRCLILPSHWVAGFDRCASFEQLFFIFTHCFDCFYLTLKPHFVLLSGKVAAVSVHHLDSVVNMYNVFLFRVNGETPPKQFYIMTKPAGVTAFSLGNLFDALGPRKLLRSRGYLWKS